MAKKHAKATVYIGADGDGRFRVKSASGRIVGQGEGYKGRTPGEKLAKARRGLDALLDAAAAIRAAGDDGVVIEHSPQQG